MCDWLVGVRVREVVREGTGFFFFYSELRMKLCKARHI